MKVGQDLQDDSGLQEAHFVQLVSSCFVSIRVIRGQIKSERPAMAEHFDSRVQAGLVLETAAP